MHNLLLIAHVSLLKADGGEVHSVLLNLSLELLDLGHVVAVHIGLEILQLGASTVPSLQVCGNLDSPATHHRMPPQTFTLAASALN